MFGVSEANSAFKRSAAERELKRALRRMPSRFAGGSAVPRLRLQIIGGNELASGIPTIQYSATVTPLAVYDPDVDTVYPTGLGNAWLWVNDEIDSRVLARNRFAGDQAAWFSGRFLDVTGTEILTYSATDMTVYTAS